MPERRRARPIQIPLAAGPSRTCRRRFSLASRPTPAATSGRSACCSTRWQPAICRSGPEPVRADGVDPPLSSGTDARARPADAARDHPPLSGEGAGAAVRARERSARRASGDPVRYLGSRPRTGSRAGAAPAPEAGAPCGCASDDRRRDRRDPVVQAHRPESVASEAIGRTAQPVRLGGSPRLRSVARTGRQDDHLRR
jgi:hypothetical protein